MDAGQCLSIVQQALHETCAVAAKHDAPAPNSTADSLAAVATAIALATFALGVIVAFATVGWFVYVRHRTREEGKTEVEKVAPAHIKAYLEDKLPGMVSEALAALTLPGDAAAPGTMTGQEQGEALGEDAR